MLGSRFDLTGVIEELASRREEGQRHDEARKEASCIQLEREMAAVAETVHRARHWVRFRCPVCDDTMRILDECDLSEFRGLDAKLHRLECDTCGMQTGRVYHPEIGYHSHLVR